MLILVVSTETFEAIGSLAINAVFLCLLVRKRPMIRCNSHIFKGSNLFHLAEVSAATTTIVGCLLANAGSLGTNENTEMTVGALFTFINLAFIVVLTASFVYEFKIENKEEEKKRNSNRADLEEGGVEMTSNPVLEARGGGEIFESWQKAFRTATENDLTAAAKADLVAELPLEMSRIIKLVRKEFLLTTKGVTIEDVESVRKRAADINVNLEKMQANIDSLDLKETLFEKVPRVDDLFSEADGPKFLTTRYCLAEIRFEQSLNLDENLPGRSASFKEKKKKERVNGSTVKATVEINQGEGGGGDGEEAPPPPPLPSVEWEKIWSETEGVYYFVNRRTLLSVWDRPAGFQDTELAPPPPVREHCTDDISKKDRKLAMRKLLFKEEVEADALKAERRARNVKTPAVKQNLHNLIKIIASMNTKVSMLLMTRLDKKLDQLNLDFDCMKFLESINDHKTASRIGLFSVKKHAKQITVVGAAEVAISKDQKYAQRAKEEEKEEVEEEVEVECEEKVWKGKSHFVDVVKGDIYNEEGELIGKWDDKNGPKFA